MSGVTNKGHLLRNEPLEVSFPMRFDYRAIDRGEKNMDRSIQFGGVNDQKVVRVTFNGQENCIYDYFFSLPLLSNFLLLPLHNQVFGNSCHSLPS